MLTLPTLLALTTSTASAANSVRRAGNSGLGLTGGSFVSGLSVKYFLSDDMAIQGALGGGWRFGGVGLSGALLWEMPTLVEEDDFDLAWNVGPGAAFWTYGYDGYPYDYGLNYVALTAVLGLELDLNDVPLDVVLEWRPGIYIVSVGSGVYADSGAGLYLGAVGGSVRYYF
jgi:hypothetical protein